MVQVPRHVADKGRVDYLETGVVFAQAEHVATEVELLLADVSHGFAYHLTDVLRDHCVLFCRAAQEES